MHDTVPLSTGEKVDNEKFLNRDEAKLKKAQRGLARQQKGSKHREAAGLVRPLAFAAWTRIHRLQDGFSEEQTRSVRAELERAPLLAFDDFGKGHFTP